MATTAHSPHRWMDKYGLATGQNPDLRRLSLPYQEEMTTVAAVYLKNAVQYLPADRLDRHLHLIFAFMAWIYHRGKPVREVAEDDLFGYFVWLAKQGCPMEQWSFTAGAITDLFQVLRQEGLIHHNPLHRVYKIFTEREQLLHSILVQATPYPLDPPATPPSPPVAPTNPPTVIEAIPARSKPVQALSAPASVPAPTRARPIVPPVVWQGIHTHKTVSMTLALLLIVGLAMLYHQNGTKPEQQATMATTVTLNPGAGNEPKAREAVSTRHPRPGDTPPQGVRKGPIIDFFYQNGLKDYYCRDYRKIPCDASQVLLNPIPAEPENVYEGGDHYLGVCGRCHGAAGQGNGPDAVRLNRPLAPLSKSGGEIPDRDAYLFWIVAQGGGDFGGKMPPFKDLLDENAIWKVILFLKTLR